MRTESFSQILTFYHEILIIHDFNLKQRNTCYASRGAQLKLKSQVPTQTIFAFSTAILSEYTTDRPSLLFLPTTNSRSCLIRSQCGPNRTEYKVNHDNKAEQQRYLWITNHVDFWESITHQSTAFKYFWDTKQPPGLHVVFIMQLGKCCWRGASPEVS